jgi:hypothetical protein
MGKRTMGKRKTANGAPEPITPSDLGDAREPLRANCQCLARSTPGKGAHGKSSAPDDQWGLSGKHNRSRGARSNLECPKAPDCRLVAYQTNGPHSRLASALAPFGAIKLASSPCLPPEHAPAKAMPRLPKPLKGSGCQPGVALAAAGNRAGCRLRRADSAVWPGSGQHGRKFNRYGGKIKARCGSRPSGPRAVGPGPWGESERAFAERLGP